jgi:ATPase subunit of ABC transporter with duplicated ATPase domains
VVCRGSQEEKEYINRFRSNAARAAQVKSREAALEKLMKSDDYVKRPPAQVTLAPGNGTRGLI